MKSDFSEILPSWWQHYRCYQESFAHLYCYSIFSPSPFHRILYSHKSNLELIQTACSKISIVEDCSCYRTFFFLSLLWFCKLHIRRHLSSAEYFYFILEWLRCFRILSSVKSSDLSANASYDTKSGFFKLFQMALCI